MFTLTRMSKNRAEGLGPMLWLGRPLTVGDLLPLYPEFPMDSFETSVASGAQKVFCGARSLACLLVVWGKSPRALSLSLSP